MLAGISLCSDFICAVSGLLTDYREHPTATCLLLHLYSCSPLYFHHIVSSFIPSGFIPNSHYPDILTFFVAHHLFEAGYLKHPHSHLRSIPLLPISASRSVPIFLCFYISKLIPSSLTSRIQEGLGPSILAVISHIHSFPFSNFPM